jgi:hypothetical protein
MSIISFTIQNKIMTKWENELILGDFGLAVQLKDPTEKRRY